MIETYKRVTGKYDPVVSLTVAKVLLRSFGEYPAMDVFPLLPVLLSLATGLLVSC